LEFDPDLAGWNLFGSAFAIGVNLSTD